MSDLFIGMIEVDWIQITEKEDLPPFGNEFIRHMEGKGDSVFPASCSVWNLLYKTMTVNGLEVGEVAFEEKGKPYFKDSPLSFSLAHSHGLCAVAVADCPVGVDIEICRSSYKTHLIERSLCEAEKAVFDGDFTRIWCRKEAVAKMTGQGITGYPDYIDTTEYAFQEKLIEYEGLQYWLVAVIESGTGY